MRKRRLKETIFKSIFFVIFLALFALLVISVNVPWNEVFHFIFMFLILLMAFVFVLYPLIKKERTNFWEIIFVVFCILLLVAGVIIFDSLAKGTLRDPVIQISAAAIGGLISLYGIGLTIKYNRIHKEEDDIEKAKPNIFPISKQMWDSLDKNMKYVKDIEIRNDLSTVSERTKGNYTYQIVSVFVANSDLSMCTFKGMIVNGNDNIVFQYDNILLKGSNNCFNINYFFKTSDELNNLQLVLGDMLGNVYACCVSFVVEENKKTKTRIINIMSTLKTEILNSDKFNIFKPTE